MDKIFYNKFVNVPINTTIIGKIGSAYGIYGWVKIFSFTVEKKNILSYQPWFIKNSVDNYKLIKLENWKFCNKNIIVKIINVKNREEAKLLTNCLIIINSLQLPKLDDNNYYWKDLLGYKVININNYYLGYVIDLIETKSNDVLVVKADFKDIFFVKKRLIPFVDNKIIKKIDLISNIIRVDWNPDFDI